MKSETLLHLNGLSFDGEVLKSDKPVLVDFYADWCGPCRMVAPVIESLSEEYSGRVKFVKIDTDSNQDLAMRYSIFSIPTIMLFKKGEIVEKIIGAAPASVYRKKLDSVLRV